MTTKCGQVECDRQNGDLSLVELIQILCSDWLRYQHSYDIKTQLKAPKPLLGASLAFAVSLCLWLIKGALGASTLQSKLIRAIDESWPVW